jgi:hypothetical protein
MRNMGSIFLLVGPRGQSREQSPVRVVDASFLETALDLVELQEGADDAPRPRAVPVGAFAPSVRRPMTTAGRAGRRRES